MSVKLICNSLDCMNTSKPYSVYVKINGYEVLTAVDTCADVSIMPYIVYKKYFKDIVSLCSYTTELYCYGGEKLVVLRQIFVNVEYDDKVYGGLSMIVVKTERKQPTLFGRDW
jgi:hypothetical protein